MRKPESSLRLLIACCLISIRVAVLPAQEIGVDFDPVPVGYGAYTFGQSLEAVQTQLVTDPMFSYRGPPDVSLVPLDREPLLDVAGTSFVQRGQFQFSQDQLYAISLVLDPQLLDYFTVGQSLASQYGEPQQLAPGFRLWESEDAQIRLERPLTVKYLDTRVLERLMEESVTQDSLQQITREAFLESL